MKFFSTTCASKFPTIAASGFVLRVTYEVDDVGVGVGPSDKIRGHVRPIIARTEANTIGPFSFK